MSRKTFKCRHCGERTPWDDNYYDGLGDCCSDCYYDKTFECTLCGERLAHKLKSDFVLFKWELFQPAGIYHVLHYPFMLSSMIGSESVFDYDVLFIDRLPKPDAHYELSGQICPACAKPYEKRFREAYGGATRKWFQRNNHNALKFALETEVMRHTILKSPDILLDAELDPEDEDWLHLKERCRLPDGMRTYREWLFLEYRGVKVYSKYLHHGRPSGNWLSLSPLPRYRGYHRYNPPVFAPSSLPTWRQSLYGYQYEHPEQDREALIMAIDKGLLTPNGLHLQTPAQTQTQAA